MGKKQPAAPAAPDPVATANAQGRWNTATAMQQQAMNMVSQNTPWGTLDYSTNGTTTIQTPSGPVQVPNYTANVNLTPEQQAIFDQSQAAQQNMATIANNQSQSVQNALSDPFEFTNQDAEKWAWDLASPRILAQQGQTEEALRNRLINSGIRPGTPAWDTEMARMTNANTDQMNQLALAGRGQAFSENLATRNQPLNELNALLTGSQVQNPTQSFAQTPQTQVGGVDYAGITNNAYAAQMAGYNAQMQNRGGMMGGLFGLGGSLINAAGTAGGFGALFSDRRLKTDIQRVGQTDAGVPIYTYRYKSGGPVMMGVMAQDVPHAAVIDASGYLKVDYGRVA